MPTLKKKQYVLWSNQDAHRFLNAVKGHKWEALYWVVIYLGLRKGEVLGLLKTDLDLEKKTLTVSGSVQRQGHKLVRKEAKTESSHRELPLPDVLVKVLKEHLARQTVVSEYLFPSSAVTPIEPRNLNRHFDSVIKEQGLPKTTIHNLRHLAASELIRAGVDVRTVSAILGHANAYTTLSVYAHAFQDSMRDALDRRNIPESIPENEKSTGS